MIWKLEHFAAQDRNWRSSLCYVARKYILFTHQLGNTSETFFMFIQSWSFMMIVSYRDFSGFFFLHIAISSNFLIKCYARAMSKRIEQKLVI